MDPQRFDAFARALDARLSRRGALGGILGSLGVVALRPDLAPAAKNQRKHRRKRRPDARRCVDCSDQPLTRGADLEGCDFTGRDLSGADLRSADLQGACLQNADLTGAELRSADLEGADVRGATLTDANLDRADIRGWKAAGAVFCRTTMPDGSINSGNCPPGSGECIAEGDLCVPGIGDRCCGQGECTGGTCQCPAPLNNCGGVCQECCDDTGCGGATPHCCDGICRGCCDNADCGVGERCQAKRCICAEVACRAAGGCCEGNACNLDAAQWRPETTFGSGPGSGDEQFSNPFGVAVSRDGETVWVAERGNARVSIWTESGGTWRNQTIFGSSGSGPNEFDTAIDVAVSNDGKTAWIADIQNHRVSVWKKSGGAWANQTTFGSEGTAPDQFNFPGGVAVSNDGKTVWVADIFNNRVSVWTKAGGRWTNQTTFGSKGSGPNQLSLPGDVAVSADGKTVWVADSDNDRISVWTESGGIWSNQTTFGSTGSGPGQLDDPGYLHVSADGRTIWVSELHNNRISVWTRSGDSWTNQTTFGGEGFGPNQFSFPNGVAASADGQTVWVADSGNERISVWARACPSV